MIIIFVLGMIFIVCIAQIMKFCKWFKKNWEGEIMSHPDERKSLSQVKHNELIDTTYDEIEMNARKSAMDDLREE